MPNWVTNRIRIEGSEEMLTFILKRHVKKSKWKDYSGKEREDDFFDFNSIIPQPGSPEECPDEFRLDINPDSAVGVPEDKQWFNWYAWNCRNWGTKWGAKETQICGAPKDGEIEIWFDTAWSPSLPIYERFASMYPDLKMEIAYVEEQGPLYTGKFKFKNGSCIEANEPKEESKEAYEIMFELWGNGDDYEFDPKTNNYKPIDEEEWVDESDTDEDKVTLDLDGD